MRDKDKVRRILNYPAGEGQPPSLVAVGTPAAVLQQTIPLKPLEEKPVAEEEKE
jgi:hypothetical protein